jgi:hypothetical protein
VIDQRAVPNMTAQQIAAHLKTSKVFGPCLQFDRFDFPADCTFEHSCTFAPSSTFGPGCVFGSACTFAVYCAFDFDCVFGLRCKFDIHCRFDPYQTQIVVAGLCDKYYVYGYSFGSPVTIRAGCKSFSTEAAKTYWTNKPKRAEILAAVHYIEAVALLRNWPI